MQFLFLFMCTILCVHAQTVTDVLRDEPQLSLWLGLVKEAGLEALFDEEEGMTAFCPTNDGFKIMSSSVMKNLREDKERLRALILYHTAPTRIYYLGDLTNDMLIETANPQGTLLRSNRYPPNNPKGIVTINGARVQRQVNATNGVVHMIDRVCPLAESTIAEIALGCPIFSGFINALVGASLYLELQNATGPMTVFVPTLDAFKQLDNSTIQLFLNNQTLLRDAVGYHVMSGTYFSEGLMDNQYLSMVAGRDTEVQVHVTTDGYTKRLSGVNSARIVKSDIVGSNGVVHLVDTVLLPQNTLASCGIF